MTGRDEILALMVERGDVVGYVGATGNASGPHLLRVAPDGGDAVDSYDFLPLVC